MIPYNEYPLERRNAFVVLTLALFALLLYTRFESLAIVVVLVVGYLLMMGLVDYLLRTAYDDVTE